MMRSAHLSRCGRYRWTLTRRWDDRPLLLVVMFNPSTADHRRDDPTISTLCHRASRWGYGGIVVVNLVAMRSSAPGEVIDLVLHYEKSGDWHFRDALHLNLDVIKAEVAKAGAILLAYGQLGDRIYPWTEMVLEEIDSANERGAAIYCMGKTSGGCPIHPMARGRHRVPIDAPLQAWQ